MFLSELNGLQRCAWNLPQLTGLDIYGPFTLIRNPLYLGTLLKRTQ